MMPDATPDRVFSALQRLPDMAAGADRSERVRSRCHGALMRQRRAGERAAVRARATRRVLEPLLVGGFCVIYFMAIVFGVLRVHGLP
jgi:hypothetical protein